MSIWEGILTEARDDHTLLTVCGLILTTILVRSTSPDQRRRMIGILVLTALHVVLVPVAGALRPEGTSAFKDVRLVCLIFAAMAIVTQACALIFLVILPRLHLATPRILQEVVVASASVFAILGVASRVGFNLSGLIATSAVITAVIGFSLQDTLGNIMGGLALQVDSSIKVGDWVRVGDTTGKVVEIGWRHTAIETRNWETMIIPNGFLMKTQVLVLGRRSGQPVLWRRWVYFNVDFRYPPSEVISVVNDAIRSRPIERVAPEPAPNTILTDLHESYGRYAVRYWLSDLAVDDPTDSLVRTRVYFALKRAGIPLSIPAHALFMTEETSQRRAQKLESEHGRRRKALSHVDLFATLAEDELNQLADNLRYAPFTQGEPLTRQGTEAHWLYVIVHGKASVRVSGEGNLEREVAQLEAGNFFGEMSLMTGERRSATVVALTDVECYRLDKSAFEEIVKHHPECARHVAELLAKRSLELSAARTDLDQEARDHHLAARTSDLLDKIRDYFGLAEV